MKTFEIYLTDLTPEARERFLKFMGAESEENFDTAPIVVIELDAGASL